MKKLLVLSLLFLSSALAFAQKEVPFNGMIKFLNGEPVKGARVWIIKDYETTTNKQGRFGLTNVNPNDTITVRYKKIEYKVPVESRTSISIVLGNETDEPQANYYDAPELADLGMGFVKRRELLTPSSGIPGEVIRRSGQTSILAALQGRVAGLQINGDVVYIRGLNSINGDPTPLFLVDGVKVSNFDSVPVEMVESVEVLKDGSMYGMEGANGVIIVKTLHSGYK